jgi:SAM-dependent methyltransferase
MQKRHKDRLQYFREQELTTSKYVIPYIEKIRLISPEMHILEIGCGEGGNLKPFLDRGCSVTGIDLSENKIQLARAYFSGHPHETNLTLICENIYNLQSADQKYDLILMRDVIEHIHGQEKFMVFVKRFMHSDALFFLGFPPWQNPFGGHQQVCRNRVLAVTPYIHLLPESIYRFLLRSFGEGEATVSGLLEAKDTGISIERFENAIHLANYITVTKTFFLTNPNYEVKFNVRPRKQASWLSAVPWLRNFFTTAVYYLLTPRSY